MSAIFPSAIAATLDLLTAVNNTKVTLNVDAGIGDTTLTVDDASPLPSSGYLTFDDNESNPESVYYTGKSGNNLTGVTRAADSTAAGTHTTGAHLEQRWNAAYHNVIATEIIAIEQNLSDRFGLDSGSHVVKFVDGTVSAPGMTFANDLNTGLYRIGADDIAITTGGVKALEVNASQQVIIPKTSSQIILGVTNTSTISATAPSASRVLTIPDPGADASFVMTAGTQTIAGAKTFSGTIICSASTATFGAGGTGSTNAIVIIDGGSSSSTGPILRLSRDSVQKGAFGTYGAIFGGASENVAIYSPGGSIVVDAQGTDVATFTNAGVTLMGTTTNNDAAAGFVGEAVRSAVSNVSVGSTGTWADMTSISLGAGDWKVTGIFIAQPNGATITLTEFGISTTSGNATTGLVFGDNYVGVATPASASNLTTTIADFRISVASGTTVYLKAFLNFSIATPKFWGRLSARRPR